MRKFTPLDLSFIANAGSNERESIRNVASYIHANAGWSNADIIADFAKAQAKAAKAAQHKSTFLGGLFDLLQTPLYGVANAMDEALAGHQESDNDSVLADIAKSAGGVLTGLPRGLGAGLRGSTQMLDTLPGVDINDQWQLDPEDKTHMGDVAIRKETGMSTADAMSPEHWDEAKDKLRAAQKKGTMDKTVFELLIPDNLDDEKAQSDFLRNYQIMGIASDLGADPLNWLGAGAFSKAKTIPEAVEGLEAARNAGGTADAILSGLKTPAEQLKVAKFGDKPAIGEAVPDITLPTAKPATAGEVPAVTPEPITPEAIPDPVIGGKVRPKNSLKPTTPTVDGITQDAWDAAARLHATGQGTAQGIPDWMFESLLKQSFGLKPQPIKDILAHLKAGTKPKNFIHAPRPAQQAAIIADPAVRAADDITRSEAAIAEGGIQNPNFGGAPEGSTLGKNYQTVARIGGREGVPTAGYKLEPIDQTRLVKAITTLAVRGDKGWVYKAADLLARHKMEFPHTTNFLQRADALQKAKNVPHNPAGFAQMLRTTLAEDASNATKVTRAERILNSRSPEEILAAGMPQLSKKGKLSFTGEAVARKAPLRPYQAKLVNETATKFAPELLGDAKASGTGEGLRVNQRAKINARWSGPQQVRMYNDIVTKLATTTKLPPAVRYDVAAKILQHVEDYFLTKGMVPYSGARIKGSVEGLRLSQVIRAIGPRAVAENHSLLTRILSGEKKALATLSPEQLQAIENIKAAEAVASAPAVQEGISAAKELAAQVMKQPWSAARRKQILEGLSKVASEKATTKGAGAVAAKSAETYVKKLLADPTGITQLHSAKKLDTIGYLARSAKMGNKFNPVDKAFSTAVTNAIAKAAELPDPAALGNVAGPAARVKDWLGARFNAAYGVADMNPILRRQQASALSTAARRARYINNIARRFPPKDAGIWHEAMRAAQADMPLTGEVNELRKEISKVMENLFGGTGLKAGAVADSTVAGRSRLYLNELNNQLKRFGLGQYQFKAGKKVKDSMGNVHDFSNGADWLKSWEIWDVKNPYEFLHQIQNAVENTVHEKNMFDDIAARFGSKAKLGDVKYSINHPRLKGYYFNEAAARQGEQFVKVLKELNTPSTKSMQHLDHAISKIKASLTIYIPSHHMTNLIGDVMFNWFAGVNDVRRYKQAINVMRSQTGRYGDIAEFKNLTGPDAFKQAVARGMIGTDLMKQVGLDVSAAGNSVVTTMKNGQKITADMIYTAAMKEGILPNARVLEEIDAGTTSMLDKVGLPGAMRGKGQQAAHAISEVRDHVPRLAQFIDGIAKHNGSFASAVEKSAGNVRKWHPDGLDLTNFEKKFMKRVFPFYSWTRKAIPLAIESALVNGNKVMAYPRLMEAIALANGVDAPPGEQFPDDQLFPDWMRERGIGPVAGGPGSYLMMNPSTPALDVFSMLGHPGQTGLDMLNPMARVPLELMQGSTLGKQVPITNEADYLAQQIPGISQAGRVTGEYGVSDAVRNSEEQQRLNLLNLLLGTKATQSGIYNKSAQFDLKDYLKSQREK